MNESQLKNPLAPMEGFCGIVTALAFSPDTRWLASGAKNGLVTLWDIDSRTAIKTFDGHNKCVVTVAFSFDGKTLLSGAADGVLRAWDLDTATQLWKDEDFNGKPCSVLFVPFTGNLVWLAQDNSLKSCNPRINGTNTTIRPPLSRHKGPVNSTVFSSNGRMLASGGDDRTIKLWETGTGSLLRTLSGHSDCVQSVAFSPNGRTLASGSDDNTVKLWEPSTGTLLRTLAGHSGSVHSVAFSPSGRKLASSSADLTIKLWETSTGRLLQQLVDSHIIGFVLSIAFSPDGRTLASAVKDEYYYYTSASRTKCVVSSKILIWKISTGAILLGLEGHSKNIRSVVFSPDGQTLASGSDDQTIKLWETASGTLLRTLAGHSNSVYSVAFSPDGGTLASCSADRTIKLWETCTGTLLRTYPGNSNNLYSIAFSPDGLTIVSGSEYGSLRHWQIDSGEITSITREEIIAIGNGPDDQRVLMADRIGRLWCFELTPDSKERLIGHTDFMDDFQLSQSLNGHFALMTSASQTTMLLVDLATGLSARSFVGHKKPVLSAALSPDETFVVSGGEDRTIHLWRVATGEIVRTMRAHTASVRAVTISPDGRYIASGGDDQTIKLWHGPDPGGAATAKPVVAPPRWHRGMPPPDSPPASLAVPGATQELRDAMKLQFDTYERRLAKLESRVEKLFRLLDTQGKAPSDDAVIIQRKSFDDF